MTNKSTEQRVAAIQSSYIPWRGYFDIINMVDVFVIYDDVQYTKNDWRNRNLINSFQGPQWLTIPVRKKGRFGQQVYDVQITDAKWARKHWQTILTNYGKAPYFASLSSTIEEWYERASQFQYLTDVNRLFLVEIARLLGISTDIVDVRNFQLNGGRVERLVDLCSQLGATEYITGPSAGAYLDSRLFFEEGVRIRWMSYEGYPDYPRLHGEGSSNNASVLDLLLNVGVVDSTQFFLSTKRGVCAGALPGSVEESIA